MRMRPPVRVFLINELLSQKVIYLTWSLSVSRVFNSANKTATLRGEDPRDSIIRRQYFMIPSFRFNPIFFLIAV